MLSQPESRFPYGGLSACEGEPAMQITRNLVVAAGVVILLLVLLVPVVIIATAGTR